MKKFLILPILILGLVLCLSGCTQDEPVMGGSGSFVQLKTPLNAVTATTTSEAMVIKGAERVTLYLLSNIPASGHGTTTYDVDVSLDGTTFVDYNKLIDNVTNTNAQGLTRVADKEHSATTTSLMAIDLKNEVFHSFKIKATLDGTVTNATAKALIDY